MEPLRAHPLNNLEQLKLTACPRHPYFIDWWVDKYKGLLSPAKRNVTPHDIYLRARSLWRERDEGSVQHRPSGQVGHGWR